MEQETLLQKIDTYLATQKPKHSLAWRQEIERRINDLNSNFPVQQIRGIHSKMLEEMLEKGRQDVKGHFPKYAIQRIEDIVSNAYLKWYAYFDCEKSVEGAFLNVCIVSENSNDYKKENPLIAIEVAIDDSGQVIFNKKGKLQKVEVRAFIKRTDFTENQKETDETEEDELLQPKADDDEIAALGLADDGKVDEEKKTKRAFDILQRENRILNARIYDDVRLKLEEEDQEAKPKRVKASANASRIKAVEIIFRHYQLKDAAASQGINTAPVIAERFIPQTDFINDIKKGDNWNGFYTATGHFKKRNSILKTATEREYMELCINALKEGINVFDKEIKDGHFKQSEKKTTPILSSVAVDKNNELIGYCHKGQVVSHNPQKERRTFQKHCEYTLFQEIIKSEEDIQRLKGGTLFVTLEPCNKRTFYCLNEDCNDSCTHEIVEVKIPCAVRCLEVGIAKVFIGSYDTNKEVEKKGVEILETGCYSFVLRDGHFFSTAEDIAKKAKEIKSQVRLEKHFQEQGYQLVEESQDKKRYRINDGIKVESFYPDLIEEVCELNGQFLAYHNGSNYY